MKSSDIIDILWNVFFLIFAFALIGFDFQNYDCFAQNSPCRYKEEFGANTAAGKLRNLGQVSTWKIALGYALILAIILGPVMTGKVYSFAPLLLTAIFISIATYFTLSWFTFHFFNPNIEDVIQEYNL